jgi:hypothetical protein
MSPEIEPRESRPGHPEERGLNTSMEKDGCRIEAGYQDIRDDRTAKKLDHR